MVDTRILLASDLDRTILPNGDQPESPRARPFLRALAARGEVTLVYVSGRSKTLQQKAIEHWLLPDPRLAIGDVGTTVYEISPRGWRIVEDWHREIATSWDGRDREAVAAVLDDVDGLDPQPDDQQARFKASYFVRSTSRPTGLLEEVGARLDRQGLDSNLIWSVDEAEGIGLLDVLPAAASKEHALRFVMGLLGADPGRAVFAGDSGNDLDALTSGLQAVLVANARDEVRREAEAMAEARGTRGRLYLATGGFLGMNGNYAAGVLEGADHFLPEVGEWLRRTTLDQRPGAV